MNTIDFAYWLQGFFEISGSDTVTDAQVKIIKAHLNLVFLHEIDPLRESETTATKEEMDAIHNGTKIPSLKPPFNKPNIDNWPSNDPLVRC